MNSTDAGKRRSSSANRKMAIFMLSFGVVAIIVAGGALVWLARPMTPPGPEDIQVQQTLLELKRVGTLAIAMGAITIIAGANILRKANRSPTE